MIRHYVGVLLVKRKTNSNCLKYHTKRNNSLGYNSEISTTNSLNNNNSYNSFSNLTLRKQNSKSNSKEKTLLPNLSNNNISSQNFHLKTKKKNKITENQISLNEYFVEQEIDDLDEKEKINYSTKQFFDKVQDFIFKKKEFENLNKKYNFYKPKNKEDNKYESYQKKHLEIYSNFIEKNLLKTNFSKTKEYFFKYSLRKPIIKVIN